MFKVGKGMLIPVEWNSLNYNTLNNTFSAIKGTRAGVLSAETGNAIINPVYQGINWITEDLVSMQDDNNKWHLFDLQGKEYLENMQAEYFSSIIADFKQVFSGHVLQDVDFANLDPPRRGDYNPFFFSYTTSNEFLVFKQNNKFGVLKRQDWKVIIPPTYEHILCFSDRFVGFQQSNPFPVVSILNLSGELIKSDIIYLSYNASLDVVEWVDKSGAFQISLATTQRPLVSAKFNPTAIGSSLSDAIKKNELSINNVVLLGQKDSKVNLPGTYANIFPIGKAYYLSLADGIIQIDPIAGIKQKIPADQIIRAEKPISFTR